jgi:hypothetical protein
MDTEKEVIGSFFFQLAQGSGGIQRFSVCKENDWLIIHRFNPNNITGLYFADPLHQLIFYKIISVKKKLEGEIIICGERIIIRFRSGLDCKL